MAAVRSNSSTVVAGRFTLPADVLPAERVSVSVAILDQDLRADAIRVNATRQTLQGGQWAEAPVAAATIQRLEDIILTKARELRRSTVN